MKVSRSRRPRIAITVATAVLSTIMAIAPGPASAETIVTNIPNPDAYSCPETGFIDFETFPDKTNISEQTFPGVEFTTTNGYTWRVGDFATGTTYNGKYPDGEYTSQGTHWAWLGTAQGSGRIEMVEGAAGFLSLLVSSESPVYLEAYDESGALLETAASTSGNVDTGSMDELRIERATDDISYVIVHDSGNFFIVDAVCTDAPGVTPLPEPPSPPPAEGILVGLGDSVGAGYGLGPSNGYRNSNGEPGGNNPSSYPHVLASELGIESYNFAIAGACAATPGKDGAHPRTPAGTQEHPRCTKSILTDQLERLRQTGIMPTIVTITVGGNDIDFSGCFESALGLSEAEPCKGSAFNDRLAALHANLSKVLDILETRYPDTRVIVTEYFNPLPPEPRPLEDSCALSHLALLAKDSQRYVNLLRKDAFLLLDEVATLQGQLHLTATEIVGSLNRALGATADLYEADVVSLDFTGHDVCRAFSATEIRYYGFLTGNGRIEVPAQTGEARVFAPAVRAFALLENRYVSVFIDLRLSPTERCRVACNEVEVIPGPPFTAILRANGFPHPTAAGQKAIADRIRFASGL